MAVRTTTDTVAAAEFYVRKPHRSSPVHYFNISGINIQIRVLFRVGASSPDGKVVVWVKK